jgi:DNA-binding MarR family transcriptional regulator
MTTDELMAASKLSVLQKRILLDIASDIEHNKTLGEYSMAAYWAEDNRLEWRPGLSSRSESAAVSRSLRRLEERGLVQRRYTRSHARTDKVALTALGMRIINQLKAANG